MQILVGGGDFPKQSLFRRQINSHRRAHTLLARHRHAAAVVRHDAVGQRQAEAAMRLALGGEERLENARQNFRVNSLAVVHHLHANVGAGRKLHVAVLRRFRQFHVARGHRDLALAFQSDGLDRVFQNFRQRHLHFGLVKPRAEKAAFRLFLPGDFCAVGIAEKIHATVGHLLRLPGGRRRVSFSWRLNVWSSFAISAARSADFSTSSSECRHG